MYHSAAEEHDLDETLCLLTKFKRYVVCIVLCVGFLYMHRVTL